MLSQYKRFYTIDYLMKISLDNFTIWLERQTGTSICGIYADLFPNQQPAQQQQSSACIFCAGLNHENPEVVRLHLSVLSSLLMAIKPAKEISFREHGAANFCLKCIAVVDSFVLKGSDLFREYCLPLAVAFVRSGYPVRYSKHALLTPSVQGGFPQA